MWRRRHLAEQVKGRSVCVYTHISGRPLSRSASFVWFLPGPRIHTHTHAYVPSVGTRSIFSWIRTEMWNPIAPWLCCGTGFLLGNALAPQPSVVVVEQPIRRAGFAPELWEEDVLETPVAPGENSVMSRTEAVVSPLHTQPVANGLRRYWVPPRLSALPASMCAHQLLSSVTTARRNDHPGRFTLVVPSKKHSTLHPDRLDH